MPRHTDASVDPAEFHTWADCGHYGKVTDRFFTQGPKGPQIFATKSRKVEEPTSGYSTNILESLTSISVLPNPFRDYCHTMSWTEYIGEGHPTLLGSDSWSWRTKELKRLKIIYDKLDQLFTMHMSSLTISIKLWTCLKQQKGLSPTEPETSDLFSLHNSTLFFRLQSNSDLNRLLCRKKKETITMLVSPLNIRTSRGFNRQCSQPGMINPISAEDAGFLKAKTGKRGKSFPVSAAWLR